ncbi:MAG: alpha/beta hydrolase [Vicinamibacteria bacterium]
MIRIEEWEARGRTIEVPEGRVFLCERGPADDPCPVLFLHGFPTSSWDFAPLMEIVSQRRRAIAFDFIGFGLSDKPDDHGYGLFEHADVAQAVARATGITRAHVLAHDLGTSVATELCARRERGFLPFALASLVLMNGSVHIELAQLTVGQRLLRSPLGSMFARLNSQRTFAAQMRRIFARPPTDADLDGMWRLLARAGGTLRLPETIRYVDDRWRFNRRWIGALERLNVPTLVAWAERDPVAVTAIADALEREIPGAQRVRWPELGHYPQVEDPQQVAASVQAFWDRVG